MYKLTVICMQMRSNLCKKNICKEKIYILNRFRNKDVARKSYYMK